jgi:hypothetical protein
MQKRVARTLSRIFTVSNASKQDIGRDFNIPLKRFRVIPNGIDTDLFYPIPEVKREKNRIIVTSSAETPLKGLRYLLQGVAAISAFRKIKLVVVGDLRQNGAIEKFGIEIFFSGLLLLRTSVMIDGKKNTVVLSAGGTDIDGRFSAVTPDFQTGPKPAGFQRDFIQGLSFADVQKTFNGV